ncbi:MAG: hypothetical protein IJA23_03885, partial [Clostridia bacterium]|nr:hypothetical protein [Clostridia bacterium]
YSGYIINNISIKYGEGDLIITRTGGTNGYGIDSKFASSKYTYEFDYADNRDAMATAGNAYEYMGIDFISWVFDEATGAVKIVIFGIYDNVQITAFAESFITFRLEAAELPILSTADHIDNVTLDNIGFEFYVGIQDGSNQNGSKIPLDYIHDSIDTDVTYNFAGSKALVTHIESGETPDGYYVEIIFIGMAKTFDDGYAIRTVSHNYSYRMTNFEISNGQAPLSGSYRGNSNDSNPVSTRYKVVYIDDVTLHYEASNIDTINSNFGGYTFAKFDVNAVNTTVNIDSYFYVLNDDGNIVNTRIDPLQNNSWFNGQRLSDIVLSYYDENRDASMVSYNYETDTMNGRTETQGRMTHQFVGNNYIVTYKEIEGYELTMFNYLGTKYYIVYNADKDTPATAETYTTNSNIKIMNESGAEVELPYSLDLRWTNTSNTEYGTYVFTIKADTNTFAENTILFYSSPKEITVRYNFNRHDQHGVTSPAIMNGDAEGVQKFWFNQIENLQDNGYAMVGYTFFGYSTVDTFDQDNFLLGKSAWSNESSWLISRTTVHQTDIWSESHTLYGTGFFAVRSNDINNTPSFVSYENSGTYVYNFYNSLKDRIHNSMYGDHDEVILYSVWKQNKYNLVFDTNDSQKGNGSTIANFYSSTTGSASYSYHYEHYFIDG